MKEIVQKLGRNLSAMIMPIIGAFIAWGFLTALFISDGWFPNENIASLVDPMITYMLPLLIAYMGGRLVYDERGGIIGVIATMGVIVGSDIPQFFGAMIFAPTAAILMKYLDAFFFKHTRQGFEMLVNNFSLGILGMILAIFGFFLIGPIITYLTNLFAIGVQYLIDANVIFLTSIFIEPAKILFLNNAINHGILTPLGTQQASETGKSILFLLETNPGPGLGILLAYTFWGKGNARATAPGAAIIQFFGGIHEIYFPYVLAKPALFISVILGGMSGVFTFNLLGAGLLAPASPGSIITILALTPANFQSYIAVLSGILVSVIVTLIASYFIFKLDKGDINIDEAKDKTMENKNKSKGLETKTTKKIESIIFVCDAGMGSSALGASLIRSMLEEENSSIKVTNCSIKNLTDDYDIVVTQEIFKKQVEDKAPDSNVFIVKNFLDKDKYQELIDSI